MQMLRLALLLSHFSLHSLRHSFDDFRLLDIWFLLVAGRDVPQPRIDAFGGIVVVELGLRSSGSAIGMALVLLVGFLAFVYFVLGIPCSVHRPCI